MRPVGDYRPDNPGYFDISALDMAFMRLPIVGRTPKRGDVEGVSVDGGRELAQGAGAAFDGRRLAAASPDVRSPWPCDCVFTQA